METVTWPSGGFCYDAPRVPDNRNTGIFCTPKPSPPGKVDRAQPGTDEGRKTYTFTPPIYTVFSV